MTRSVPETTPVIVGAAQLLGGNESAEPIDFLTRVSLAALADGGTDRLTGRIDSVRIVRGINPYQDPGRLVAEHLGLPDASTGHTQIGGQEAYDLVARTAADIAAGSLDVAIVAGAETMRTRRRDKAAGRRSAYLVEREGARADHEYGSPEPYWDDHDNAAGVSTAVNFYALAESALRHRRARTVDAHTEHISRLWARAAEVASGNPYAAIRTKPSAEEIRTPTDKNRMVASPYPKLMTSNVNVDMAAAVVLCSAGAAASAGVPRDRWVFPLAAAGAHDHWQTRTRADLDRSPAMRFTGAALLDAIGLPIDEWEHVDLYSCFPVAVQLAYEELGRSEDLPFTITGGLTFNGGPLNTYCLHPLTTAVDRVRNQGGRAFLTGNGGFLTKHSALALGDAPPDAPFARHRPQAAVDALPSRESNETFADGTVEAHTTVYDRSGQPDHAVVSVLSSEGARRWAHTDDPAAVDPDVDLVGRSARLDGLDDPVPSVHID